MTSATSDLLARNDTIGTIGAAWYFAPATVAVGKEHGLDGFRFYFLGRGGVLGDVEAEVVLSAFGYFEPTLLARMWDTARERMAPRDAARLYLRCAHDFGRARLAGVDGLEAFCAAAEHVNSGIDPAGLALYAGIDAEPLPDDPAARAVHLCAVLREARGSTHLLAVVANGLSPRVAHHIKRPTEVKLFGWDEDGPEPTADERRRWDAAEALTDALLAPAYARLDESGREALVTGLDRISAALS